MKIGSILNFEEWTRIANSNSTNLRKAEFFIIFKTMTVELTPDVEFGETTGDGRELKVIIFDCIDEFDRCFLFISGYPFVLKMVNGFKKCMTRMEKNRR
jgi:hypothetical protein